MGLCVLSTYIQIYKYMFVNMCICTCQEISEPGGKLWSLIFYPCYWRYLHIMLHYLHIMFLFSHADSETPACQASLSLIISQSLLKLRSIEWVMLPNHLILCHPLLLLPSIFPGITVFSNESSVCIMWPKLWIFSFSISPSNEYSGLISFRIDWFDLLAVQGTLMSLL